MEGVEHGREAAFEPQPRCGGEAERGRADPDDGVTLHQRVRFRDGKRAVPRERRKVDVTGCAVEQGRECQAGIGNGMSIELSQTFRRTTLARGRA